VSYSIFVHSEFWKAFSNSQLRIPKQIQVQKANKFICGMGKTKLKKRVARPLKIGTPMLSRLLNFHAAKYYF
jgi:hypothetical protein